MKKLFLSILAVATLASCTKDESFYTEQDSEIKISPVTAMSVKSDPYTPVYGAIDGTNYPDERFDVYAYWAKDDAGSKFTSGFTTYLTDNTSGVEFKKKGQYWGGSTTYYWPKNGSLRFAAYSPASVDMTHDLVTDTYSVDYTQESKTDLTQDLLVAPTTPSYTAQTATENVSVVFEHALSWITLKVKAATPEAAAAFKVYDMSINDVYTNATLDAAMADGIQASEWTNHDSETKAVYEVVKGKKITLTTSAEVVEDVDRGTVVIPQVPTTLTINFQQNTLAEEVMTVTIPLELDDETNNIWEPGKHYIYTVIFDLDEILINPSVEDWEDVVVDDKDMDDAGQIATVATEAELKAALAKVDENGNHTVTEIELTSNIELTSQLNVNYSVAFTNGGFTGKPVNVTGAVVSFENVVFNNATGEKETSVYVREGNTNITFDGCTFDNYTWEAIQYVAGDGKWACITNCIFKAAAHRDVHFQTSTKTHPNGTKAELKMTNNEFYGDDVDSYVTVLGFKHEQLLLENNYTEKPANSVNVWIEDVYNTEHRTIVGFANGKIDGTKLTASTLLDQNVELTNLTTGDFDIQGLPDVNGNFPTLKMTESTATDFVTTTGGFIKDVNILGYFERNTNNKLLYGIKVSGMTSDVNICNVTVDGVAYALNTGTINSAYKMNVMDCTLHGWISFAGVKEAKFTNTNFKIGSFFARTDANVETQNNCNFKPYVKTVLENCTFEKGFYLDLCALAADATVTFKNCTVDGVKLTADNFTTYMNLDDNHEEGSRWNNVKFE